MMILTKTAVGMAAGFSLMLVSGCSSSVEDSLAAPSEAVATWAVPPPVAMPEAPETIVADPLPPGLPASAWEAIEAARPPGLTGNALGGASTESREYSSRSAGNRSPRVVNRVHGFDESTSQDVTPEQFAMTVKEIEGDGQGWPEGALVGVIDARPSFYQLVVLHRDVQIIYTAEDPQPGEVEQLRGWAKSAAARLK